MTSDSRSLGAEHSTGVDREQPSDDLLRAVLELVDACTAADGVGPFSEQALLRLRHRAPAVTHAASRDADGRLVGYLQLATDDGATVAELAVSPEHRRRGIGAALASWAIQHIGADRTIRAWAHGNGDAAAALGTAMGFHPHRVLLQMQRPAGGPLPAVEVPAGVRIRTFQPGADDDAWVRVNARAFAGHPEQAGLGVGDLRERMAEQWFDPAGFFVAERMDSSRLVGFHWTKVHDRERLGEVYVVGIDPSERGTGLGLALTVTGLAHLAAAGLPTLMLYADESNTNAVRMYERLGFTVASTDVTYER